MNKKTQASQAEEDQGYSLQPMTRGEGLHAEAHRDNPYLTSDTLESMQEAQSSTRGGKRNPAARGLQEVGESHETLGGWGWGAEGTNPEHVARGTLSAGRLLCDKSPFVLTEERIPNLQFLQMKSAGPSARARGGHCFSCISADNMTSFQDS